MNLNAALPRLLPKAIAWAREMERLALETGDALPAAWLDIARRVGVQAPGCVRLLRVDRMPQPEDPELREAADALGLLGPTVVGLTLGYAVFILAGEETVSLLSHECRHVHQYEENGGIPGFLPVYLEQVLACGYQDAPLEIDARAHEIHAL